MRKNTQEVYRAWKMGRALHRCRSIWTDGETVYSYSTPILRYKLGAPMMNMVKYSRTTSNHQNSLTALLADAYSTSITIVQDPNELF